MGNGIVSDGCGRALRNLADTALSIAKFAFFHLRSGTYFLRGYICHSTAPGERILISLQPIRLLIFFTMAVYIFEPQLTMSSSTTTCVALFLRCPFASLG